MRRLSKGFSLIELLLVVSILAVTAGIGMTVYFGSDGDVDSNARLELTRVEMMNIVQAIRQFKQDTGYYPGEGPFGLPVNSSGNPVDCDDALISSSVPGISFDSVTDTSLQSGDTKDWFNSPVNIGQLISRPIICGYNPEDYPEPDDSSSSIVIHPLYHLSVWDPKTQKGWRGPYIEHEGYVDVSPDLTVRGSGDPVANVLIAAVRNIPALMDPFDYHDPEKVSFVNVDALDGELLDWRSLPDSRYTRPPNSDATADEHDKAAHRGDTYYLGRPGSPYMLFGRDGCTPLRLVSMGPDGVYDGINLPQGDDPEDKDYDPEQMSPPQERCNRHNLKGTPPVPLKEFPKPEICTPVFGSDDLVVCI